MHAPSFRELKTYSLNPRVAWAKIQRLVDAAFRCLPQCQMRRTRIEHILSAYPAIARCAGREDRHHRRLQGRPPDPLVGVLYARGGLVVAGPRSISNSPDMISPMAWFRASSPKGMAPQSGSRHPRSICIGETGFLGPETNRSKSHSGQKRCPRRPKRSRKKPANCGASWPSPGISPLERMRGGAGRIRTSNQTIMDFRSGRSCHGESSYRD
jgi:hypothetical protein